MASQRRACDTARAGRKVDEAARASTAEATFPILRTPRLSSLSPHSVLRHRRLSLPAPFSFSFLLSLSRPSWLRSYYPSFFGRRSVQSGSAMPKVKRGTDRRRKRGIISRPQLHRALLPSSPPLFWLPREPAAWLRFISCIADRLWVVREGQV